MADCGPGGYYHALSGFTGICTAAHVKVTDGVEVGFVSGNLPNASVLLSTAAFLGPNPNFGFGLAVEAEVIILKSL